jgi:2OG-Fe(II) oxygenase superfamily
MKLKPTIIDNFLPDVYQKSIYDLLTGFEIPWNLFHKSVNDYEPLDLFSSTELYKEHIQFRHVFCNTKGEKSKYFQYIVPLIAGFEKETGFKVNEIVRIKSNLLLPQQGIKAQYPHIDATEGKKTLLYYVNDSDGDTVIYDQYYFGQNVGELSVHQQISPKMGRAVIFDSNQIHAGCCPTNSEYRCVINFVFECVEK